MTTMFGDISPRTGAYAAKELLKRGLPHLVLEKFGQARELPGNSTKTIKFRRYNALDNTPVALVEGVTPASQSLTVTRVPFGIKVAVSRADDTCRFTVVVAADARVEHKPAVKCFCAVAKVARVVLETAAIEGFIAL